MNTNNPNENPVASASSSRNNPCYEIDSNTAALKVFANEKSYLLTYAQFLYTERRPNPALEQGPDAPPEEIRVCFTFAEVVIRGSGLRRLEAMIHQYELKSVKAADLRLANSLNPHVVSVTLTFTKENL